MKIIRSIKMMSEFSHQVKLKAKRIGFVPTMGALHAGHLSLIRQARRENDLAVVSIFVNPLQFGPKEDFKNYPRDLKRDAALCRKEKVNILFYPRHKEMYPLGYKTFVKVEDLSDSLCGKSRPGHFRGVATVVAKLFNIVNPDVAYFGQKDAQQAMSIKRLAQDLNYPLKIKVMPTLRDKDGLALSSRNAYLNKQERSDALVLVQALKLAARLIKNGLRDVDKLIRKMKAMIEKKKAARIDYVAVVDLDTLLPVKKISDKCLIALAVWIGRTRLIDNMIVNV